MSSPDAGRPVPEGTGSQRFQHSLELPRQASQVPPQAPDIERRVLGCILLAPERAGEFLEQLSPSDFYITQNKSIFDAMVAVRGQGLSVGVVTVTQRLRDSRQQVDTAYVSQLPDDSNALEFDSYLRALKDKAQRRALLNLAAMAETVARNEDENAIALTEDFMQFGQGILSRAGLDNSGLPPIKDAATLIAEPLETPKELIKGLLHQGSKMALGGGSKSFKSWTFVDMCISVSHGLKWLGFETEKAKVLYVNLEIQPCFMQARIEAVARARGITLQPGQMDVWNLRGFSADASIILPAITNRIRQSGYGLIVLDPVYKCLGSSDENSARDIASMLNRVERLAVDAGAAVAFGAHFSKGNQAGKESIDRISGSGVFARDPDSLLIFTRHEEEGAFTVEATLRNLPPVEAFCVRWEYPLMHRDTELDPTRLKQVTGRSREYDPRKLLEVIKDTSPENSISVTDWAARAGVKRQTLNGYLPEMRQRGFIATVGDGSKARKYITKNGRNFVERGNHVA